MALSITETSLCHRNNFLSQKQVSVTKAKSLWQITNSKEVTLAENNTACLLHRRLDPNIKPRENVPQE